MQNFRWLVRTVLVVLAVGAASPAVAQSLTEVKVALAWLRNGQYSALMVADAKGYFAEAGLKLRLLDGGPGKNPVPTVGVGQADFGVVGGSNIFLARVAPDPVDIIAIGAFTQQLPYAFITLANPSDPDPQPKDLEGKTVGMQADGEIFLKAIAGKNGLDLKKIKIEIVMATAEPLLVGKVDYFTGMLHNQTYQIEQTIGQPGTPGRLQGKVWKAIRLADHGAPFYADVLFTTRTKLRNDPELVRRFSRAVARGLQFVLENPEETVKIVDTYPEQIERADKLAWRFKVQNPLSVSTDTNAHGLLWMEPKVWADTMAYYKEYGQIPRVVPTAELMTNDFNPAIRSK